MAQSTFVQVSKVRRFEFEKVRGGQLAVHRSEPVGAGSPGLDLKCASSRRLRVMATPAMTVSEIAVEDLRDEYERRGIGAWSDIELAAAVADVLRVPRRDPASSFVLHSALELQARLGLLPMVAAADRELARLHILAIAAQYEAFGPPMDDVESGPDLPIGVDPMAWLTDSLAAGDLVEIDRAAAAVAATSTPRTLPAALVDSLASPTAAAAHAPIFLYHYARVSPRRELTPEMLRPLARELGRNPDWRIRWVDDHTPSSSASPSMLEETLMGLPVLGVPGTTFIHPLMMQVDQNAAVTEALSGATGTFSAAAAQSVMRVAARSMLAEPPNHAPYGWTHCLTMPQAVLALAPLSASPDRLLAIAATHVAGFRSALGTGPLPAETPLPETRIDQTRLFSDAATSHDAHVVKYIRACVDAAATDPKAEPLYLAAAKRLLDVWQDLGGDPTDPLNE